LSHVRFSDIQAFVEEAERDRVVIDRNMVRTTFLFTQSKQYPAIQFIRLEAGYTIDGHIVKLVREMGTKVGSSPVEKAEREQREKIIADLRDQLEHLGFEVRGGFFEEGE